MAASWLRRASSLANSGFIHHLFAGAVSGETVGFEPAVEFMFCMTLRLRVVGFFFSFLHKFHYQHPAASSSSSWHDLCECSMTFELVFLSQSACGIMYQLPVGNIEKIRKARKAVKNVLSEIGLEDCQGWLKVCSIDRKPLRPVKVQPFARTGMPLSRPNILKHLLHYQNVKNGLFDDEYALLCLPTNSAKSRSGQSGHRPFTNVFQVILDLFSTIK